jgi:hypothetical protein
MKIQKTKKAKGQSTIELVAGLIIGVPMILIAIDAIILATGAVINDAACRDAARAAASGPPSALTICIDREVASGTTPHKRAKAVIERVYKSGGFFVLNDPVLVIETLRDPLPSGLTGGSLDGEVTVETRIDVKPPFLIQALVGSHAISFTNRQTYPYTYVVPNTDTSS